SITAEDIPDKHQSRVLFKTKNSGLYRKFSEDFTYIDESAARKLIEHKAKLVGIDYLSIEKFGTKGMKVHKILLNGGTVILEGLDLSQVAPGDYELICLPLKIDADGSPCRAILR
ncbi:MAG: hypothetical protein QXV22_03775, partial [Thermoplasmataceae archaeon]